MADFDDNQIGQVAASLGMSPDVVRQQLVNEGHNYTGGMNLGAMQPASLPPAAALPPPQAMNLGGMQATQLPPEVAPPAAQPSSTPGRWMVNADNLAVPAELAKPAARPAGPTGVRSGIRATGQGQAQPQAGQGAGAGQGLGRIRKLFDQRERELGAAYQGAASQVAEGQQRLAQVEQEAFGFTQDKLNLDAAHAATRAGLYDELGAQQQAADQAELVARAKEEQALQGHADKVTRLQDDYRNARVRDMPTSSRVASAFAMAFSGIADSLNSAVGNRSDFLQSTMGIVNQAIDRDVEDQLRQIEQKGGAADDAERSLMRMRQGIQDERGFRAANRAAVYDQFATRLEQQSANAVSETAKVTAAAGATEFRAQAERERAAANQAALADAQKRLRDVGDARFATEVGLAMPRGEGQAKKPLPSAGGLVQLGDATDEDRKKAQEIQSGAAGIIQNIGLLKQMARRGATLSPDERQIARRRLGALKSQFNGVFGDGTAPNEAQLEALDDMFANPTEVNLGNAERQFQVFEEDAINQTNGKLRPYKYQIETDDFEAE